MIKLSFCIPTYNRCEYLKQTLESIFSQMQEGVEIVISDNHSTDGTQAYLEKRGFKDIIYHRFEKEVSCGDNLLNSIALARGEYCWLMSDDDIVEPGGVREVLSILERYAGLTGLSVNVQGYDRELKEKKKIKYSHDLKEFTLFTQAHRAFEELGAWLGFWSAQVIHRQKWQEALCDLRYKEFIGYHHLYLMLKMIKTAPLWVFSEKKSVGYRADNESFSKEYGRYTRFAIDVNGYDKIGKTLFSSESTSVINKRVINQLLFWQLIRAKCEGLSYHFIWKMLCVSYHTYKCYSSFWFKIFPLLCFPRSILVFIRFLKNCVLKLKIWN